MNYYDDERFYEEERWDEDFYDELGGERGGKSKGPNHSGNDGCYVATCVYGSYDCPQVWTLRRFRDGVLKPNSLGRCFVRVYYAVSPCLVKQFGEITWLRKAVRRGLDHMVTALNRKGFDDAPYQDI